MTASDTSRPAEMAKAYEAQQVEQRLYDWWERSGFFTAHIDPNRKPFTMSMPPPNVTGELHMGHAMFVTIEDVIVRWHRMLGEAALWLPGTDHAGIATQSQVEKLLRSEGTSRQEVGREEFLRRTWEWKAKYGGEITRQLRRIGASCDWTRERFTLDPGLSRVGARSLQAPVRRWPDLPRHLPGQLVAQSSNRRQRPGGRARGAPGQSVVCALPTGAGDGRRIKDAGRKRKSTDPHRQSRRSSSSAWGSGTWAAGATEWITVATTRPETILGDTAIAVNPEDERYSDLIGRYALVPALGRRIPIVADSYVDAGFGTGAVKVTPAHDPNDYAIGQRHQLPMINIMNRDATLNDEAGPYAGQDRFEARKNLVADLEKEGLLVKTVPHTHVGRHQPARARGDRAAAERAVVRARQAAGRTGVGGGEGGPHTDRARALREGLLPLAGEYRGLVHQPAALVGPPHPGLVHAGWPDDRAGAG